MISKFQKLLTHQSLRPDVPLARDEANRFLPWIIALMVYLTALTLSGSFSLHHIVSLEHSEQAGSFSVHLPHTGDNSQQAVEKALAVLQDTPGVEQAAVVDAARIRAMVEPWLGRSEALNSLPLPVIIDVKIQNGDVVDYDRLAGRLQLIAPGADIDDHRQWITQFSRLVRLVQWVLFTIALMIMAASATMVIFTCKTSLKIHRSTVDLLHRLGAYDSYIAGQFQRHAALLALKGAFVGCGLAAGTLLLMHFMALNIHSAFMPTFTLNLSHWVILLTLPLVMSLIALASARISVLAALRRMP